MTSASLIAAGLALSGSSLALRAVIRRFGPQIAKAEKTVERILSSDYKYYRGGFEPKMSKREASLILGVGPGASQKRFRAAHRRIMILNHPDKAGSPYLAAKINQAKDLMESFSKL